jgi:hypothetical protein
MSEDVRSALKDDYKTRYLKFRCMFDKGAFNTDEYDPTPELSEILEELHQSESGIMSESQSDYLINQQLPIFIKVLLDRK